MPRRIPCIDEPTWDRYPCFEPYQKRLLLDRTGTTPLGGAERALELVRLDNGLLGLRVLVGYQAYGTYMLPHDLFRALGNILTEIAAGEGIEGYDPCDPDSLP